MSTRAQQQQVVNGKIRRCHRTVIVLVSQCEGWAWVTWSIATSANDVGTWCCRLLPRPRPWAKCKTTPIAKTKMHMPVGRDKFPTYVLACEQSPLNGMLIHQRESGMLGGVPPDDSAGVHSVE